MKKTKHDNQIPIVIPKIIWLNVFSARASLMYPINKIQNDPKPIP